MLNGKVGEGTVSTTLEANLTLAEITYTNRHPATLAGLGLKTSATTIKMKGNPMRKGVLIMSEDCDFRKAAFTKGTNMLMAEGWAEFAGGTPPRDQAHETPVPEDRGRRRKRTKKA